MPTRAASTGDSSPKQRRDLLGVLRRQHAAVGDCQFRREVAPELYELAAAATAAPARRRSFRFRGVRFVMRFGFWRYVLDPETGETLVAAEGGWL